MHLIPRQFKVSCICAMIKLVSERYFCSCCPKRHVMEDGVYITRSTHAYDASRRSKRHARMGCAAQVSGVARLV